MMRCTSGRFGTGRCVACAALAWAAWSGWTAAEPPRISPEIEAHRELKLRPTGVPAASHASWLRETGLDPDRPDAERCVIYVERRLERDELDDLERHGLELHRALWVPPVPGRHPYGYHLATVPYAALEVLREHPAVVRVESTEFTARPLNNLTRPLIGVDDVHAGVGVTPRDGTGVKLAVADSGLDVSHPDIPAPLEAFDVTDGTDPADWGADVSNTVIGHGTHVTGVALASGAQSAGNTGNAGGSYTGMAPGASLHFYKIGNDGSGSTTFEDMIEAVDRAAAVGVRVFTMSYGGFNSTFLDGSSPVCQAIDAAVAGGMTVFTSAGNEAGLRHHASALSPAGGSSEEFIFEVAASGGPAFGFTFFRVVWKDDFPGDANVTLTIQNLAAGESLNEGSADVSVRGTESKFYTLTYNVPAGESHMYRMRFENAAAAGPTPRVHIVRTGGTGLFTVDTDRSTTIVHPALCDGTIATAAWTQRDMWVDYQNTEWQCCNLVAGTLAPFSSRGPRVDGRRKPDLAAPGATTISTKDATFHTLNSRIIDNDGVGLDGSGPAQYYAIHGTSQAAPAAAGAAALILEAAPGLGPTGVRNALTFTASGSGNPDDAAGYGLIDALAALQSLPAPGTDADGDAVSGGEGGDCNDGDPQSWATPGEAVELHLIDRVTIVWSPPARPGGAAVGYDVLRSLEPGNFVTTASCVESGEGSDHVAFDLSTPTFDEVFYYLVRAVNGCLGHDSDGSLGLDSSGAERGGRPCS